MRSLTAIAWMPMLSLASMVCIQLRAQTFTLDPGWPQANGIVHSMALDASNGILYIGGEFTQVDGQLRERIAAIDLGTQGVTAWAPSANNTVRAIAIRGDSVFIGGNFSEVNGQPQALLAALDRTSGALSAWAPVVNGPVLCLLNAASTLYIGGAFTNVNGQTRNRLAAFDAGLGGLNAWDPNAGSQVNHLAWNGTNVLVAGIFPSVGGATRSNLAELDPSNGLATAWTANTNAVASAAASQGGRIFLGGQFTSVNGTTRQGMAEVNSTTGEVEPWTANIGGGVRAMAFDGDLVFAGGFFPTVNGTAHTHLAALDAASGALLPGSPSASSTVNSVIAHEGKLFVGGGFTLVNGGIARDRLAVFGYCTAQTWFADTDEDGFGDAGTSTTACEAPAGFVGNDDDCDDTDDELREPLTWYLDADGDEYGDPNMTTVACEQPVGYAEDPRDCDDSDAGIAPGEPCEDNDPFTTGDVLRAFPDCGCLGKQLLVSVKVFLQGPYDPVTGLMHDHLRAMGLIPLTEPYTALGYSPEANSVAGGDSMDPSVLTITGPDAIVDWVILEMRANFDGGLARSTRYVLVQRDGDVVETDGVSPVRFPLAPTNYRLAVLHRNHMGVVESAGALLNGTYYEVSTRDMSSASFEVEGSDARVAEGSVMLLRAGDTSFNDDVFYTGPFNDRDPILQQIGGTLVTNTVMGYFQEDVNMDGMVRYVGLGNDRDPILQSIGGSVPTSVKPNVYLRYTY